jgi:hypothetical protein
MDRSPPYIGDDVIGATFLLRGATVMLLTITTTHQPATDLGFLLAKHPDRVQEPTQSFGNADVFYPEEAAS